MAVRLNSSEANYPIQYFYSSNVKMFPGTYRGYYESQGSASNEQISVVFDPESRLISEYNYTHLFGAQNGLQSYVVEFTENTLCCVIAGYYFKIDNLSNSVDSGLNLFNALSSADYSDIALGICTRTSPLNNDTDTQQDSPRYLTYLSSQLSGCGSLDQYMGETQNEQKETERIFYFTGLTIRLSKNTDGANSYYTKNSADTTLYELKLKEDGKICYENFISNNLIAYSDNCSSLSGDNLGKSNLELGIGATARGEGSVSIGSGTLAGISTSVQTNGATISTTCNNSTAIGAGAKAINNSTIAIGAASIASAEGAIAIGAPNSEEYTQAVGADSIAIGRETAAEAESIALGKAAEAAVNKAVAIGLEAKAISESAVALGAGAHAGDNPNSVAVGAAATANKENTVAIGTSAKAEGAYCTSLGASAETTKSHSVAIGSAAKASQESTISLGASSEASASYTTAVGAGAKATTNGAIALGKSSEAQGTNSITIGHNTKGSGTSAITVGAGAKSDNRAINAITIGNNIENNRSNAIVIGTLGSSVTDEKYENYNKTNTVLANDTLQIGRGIIPSDKLAASIIGNYNDPLKTPVTEGSVIIATGTADTTKNRRTSCVFGVGHQAYLYETLHIPEEARADQPNNYGLIVEKNSRLKGNLKVTGNTDLTGSLSVKQTKDSNKSSLGLSAEADTPVRLEAIRATGTGSLTGTSSLTLGKAAGAFGSLVSQETELLDITGGTKDVVYQSKLETQPKKVDLSVLYTGANGSVSKPSKKAALTMEVDGEKSSTLLSSENITIGNKDITNITLSGKDIIIEASSQLMLKDKSLLQIMFNMAHPVGSIFETFNTEDLSTESKVAEFFKKTFGVESTWETCTGGSVLISANDSYAAGNTGGSTSVKISERNLPKHSHSLVGGDHAHKITVESAFSGTAITVEGGTHSHKIEAQRQDGTAYPADWRIDIDNEKGTSYGYSEAFRTAGIDGQPDGSHSHTFTPGGTIATTKSECKTSGNLNLTMGDFGVDSVEALSVVQPYEVCYRYKRIS